jgi:hypothetical protein
MLVFWALRGGGAGSWGVITSATFKTYPTFNATISNFVVTFTNATAAEMGSLMAIHAAHVKDIDSFRPGQYFYLNTGLEAGSFSLSINSYFPNTAIDKTMQAMQPFIDAVKNSGLNLNVTLEEYNNAVVNDLLTSSDDSYVPAVVYMGSRLVPSEAYEQPDKIGTMYQRLFETGAVGYVGSACFKHHRRLLPLNSVLGLRVAGG